ncbi:iron uptake porin [Phormidium sp. CLA17]|uniref:iron uptake porin n=1 Tax=Leptolyngbya sp. Cla-17 TaxID=2803751 RepID=UPI001490BBB7|nr:iron uptake porin [Leptolyngbya sp. Cla-17]MBM0741870.1 iron uptake porin [Leptolyngbya sp. Cla-17]
MKKAFVDSFVGSAAGCFATAGTAMTLGIIAGGFLATGAIAADVPTADVPTIGMEQVNSVSQLTDVQPTDWAFQALQSLVERYSCIVGYPDRTYRGNRGTTRYEFAAGLNACLDKIQNLLAAATADFVSKEDLETIKRLQEEFATELSALRGRVDGLEVRTATLEKQQFSVTTRLSGEAIFSRSDAMGGDNATGFGRVPIDAGRGVGVQQNRVRLNFLTSFNGQDLLTTRLEAGNAIPTLGSGGTTGGANSAYLLYSNEGRLAYDNSSVALSNNSVNLSLLSYRTPVGSFATVTAFASGGSHFRYAETLSPYLDDEDGGNGALSRFGQFNPIYRIGGNGAGAGIKFKLGNAFKIDVGYLASRANDPNREAGLFNGNYSALAQVSIQPGDRIGLGLTYVHAYNNAGDFRYGGAGTATGTFLGNLLPGSQGAFPSPPNRPTVTDSFGAAGYFKLSDRIVLGGWGTYTRATFLSGGGGSGDIWSYAGALLFPDLIKRGSLAGIIAGAEPSLKGVKLAGQQRTVVDRDDAFHVEAFYRYRLNDNISITPGIMWLPALNQRADNDDVFITVVRTTYSF